LRGEVGTHCPLCHGEIRIIDHLVVSQLRKRYLKTFGIPIGYITENLDRFDFCECIICRLRFFSPLRPADGQFYSHLAEWFSKDGTTTPNKPEFFVGARHVKEGDVVLDVGCGRGPFAARIPVGTRYVGLEINPSAISANGLDIRPELLSDHVLHHKEAYDVVCSFQVLEHVVDPGEFLRLCIDCLKPRGKLILSVPNADGFMGGELDNILNMPPHHLTWWNRNAVENIAKIMGLRTIEIVEESLMETHQKAFIKMLTLNFLKRWTRSSSRFFIGGTAYRVADIISKIAAHLFSSSINGVGFSIKGHSITGVYEKLF
jgi:2-polyprenyl-3-methyl-5-hydroxy-6-metoxy-1,4-benzoquinol methylase